LLSELTFSVIALPIGFASTAFLTYLIMRVGLRIGVLDVPNERSSHTSPVPRGGGLAVIVTFFVFLFAYPIVVDGPIDASIWRALLLGGAIIAVVGFIDDLNDIAARWRFVLR